MSSLIEYFIPEDGETESTPNSFIVYKQLEDIRIDDIRAGFPLKGEFHFRFKFLWNKKTCWIDFNNPNAELPMFSGSVLIKVTRLDSGIEIK